LQCSQLLGFKAGSVPKNNEVSLAYEELAAGCSIEGFSQATLDSRKELLDIVKADIIGSKSMGAADRLQTVSIPYHLVPGALVVLAEVRHLGPLNPSPYLLSSYKLDATQGFQYIKPHKS
jgi:hypothetical protein